MLRRGLRRCWYGADSRTTHSVSSKAEELHAGNEDGTPYSSLEEMKKDPLYPLYRYKRHAEQSYLWSPPDSDNDEREIGPYPRIPEGDPRSISYQLRSPHLNWDDRTNRRQHGELLPEEFDAMSLTMMDVETDYTMGEIAKMYGQFALVLAGLCYGLNWLGKGIWPERLGVERKVLETPKADPGKVRLALGLPPLAQPQ